MADKTKIRWTEATWNPMTGCTHVSPGCDNCYAARLTSSRLAHQPAYAGLAFNGRFTGEVRFHPDRLARIPKADMVFVNSMSDTFHTGFSDKQIAAVFRAMRTRPETVFQVLTKRPNRVRRWWDWYRRGPGAVQAWPEHIWLGTSVETTAYLGRVRLIAGIAPVTFVSAEPLLGPLIHSGWGRSDDELGDMLGDGLVQWVITGGESGRGARPCNLDWVRDIRNSCRDFGVPFFHKQHGGTRKIDGEWGGKLLDGQEWSQMPPMKAVIAR